MSKKNEIKSAIGFGAKLRVADIPRDEFLADTGMKERTAYDWGVNPDRVGILDSVIHSEYIVRGGK